MDHQRFCNNFGEIHVKYIPQLEKVYMSQKQIMYKIYKHCATANYIDPYRPTFSEVPHDADEKLNHN